jgi:hypothetical protein
MNAPMDVTVPMDKVKKSYSLHAAFPGLKITSNYDRLIETTVPHGVYVEVAYGHENQKIDDFFSQRLEINGLVKIHGGISDMNSIVSSAGHYQKLYGHKDRYDARAGLPAFLQKVFTGMTVLFTGCSLEPDRTAMILAEIEKKPRHFAVKKLPGSDKERILEQRRLGNMGICPVWVEDYEQIGELLEKLAGKVPGTGGMKKSAAGKGERDPRLGLFVGREKELESIGANLEMGTGGVQTITGRLYSIDGAGGVGKTALALEAARDLGFLPLALRQAAALMVYTPHYLPAVLRDKLKGDSRLEEAMTLHQKEEKIKEELGDCAGLAICWWNQGLIHKQKNDPHAQARLWQKAIDTKKAIGIPTTDDEKELKELIDW